MCPLIPHQRQIAVLTALSALRGEMLLTSTQRPLTRLPLLPSAPVQGPPIVTSRSTTPPRVDNNRIVALTGEEPRTVTR